MGRLDEAILNRAERFADAVLDATDELAKRSVSRRVLEQVIAAGTSVGANLFEADEAMSRPDFVRCVCITIKELNETRFWLRLCVRRNWLSVEQTTPIVEESDQLRRILGAMVARTRRSAREKPTPVRSEIV